MIHHIGGIRKGGFLPTHTGTGIGLADGICTGHKLRYRFRSNAFFLMLLRRLRLELGHRFWLHFFPGLLLRMQQIIFIVFHGLSSLYLFANNIEKSYEENMY
jgi:hypothetical protein